MALAARYNFPAIYEWREFAQAGGFASYGTNLVNNYRLAGAYTGRVLKGEKPAELPVVQATKFEFVTNLKTAKTLRLDVSSDGLSARADDVIEYKLGSAMSAFGTKRTSLVALHMSAFGGKADMGYWSANVRF